MYNSAYGIDYRELVPLAPRKSIGAEVNYGIRFMGGDGTTGTSGTTNPNPNPNPGSGMHQAITFISKFCREIFSRMVAVCVKGSHLSLKVRQRSPGAPMEPKKYMGCGRCDQYTR